jgi:DNA invertase Pin-like site-specific DNA recombinase
MHDEYWMYLRKSRADRDAELRGEGETLARHEHILTEFAHKHHMIITKVFKEIVSGETISERPEMQKLLKGVENRECKGVLVVEVERLARGNTTDQGIVADAFKYGNALIITPYKTYDPNNEFDEEYFEFGLFMSRREYKTINRRIQRGRYAAVKEGKWIYGMAPYPYRRIKMTNDTGYTLEPIPEEVEIFLYARDIYKNGLEQEDGTRKYMGFGALAKHLDSMHLKPRNGEYWSRGTLKDIFRNPVPAGMIRWKWRPYITTMENGSKVIQRVKDHDCELYKGLHQAVISWEDYTEILEIMESRIVPTLKNSKKLQNPLSGLVYCKKCDRMLTRSSSHSGKKTYFVLRCPNPYCDNISAPIDLIEAKILDGLRSWLNGYKMKWNQQPIESNSLKLKETAITKYESELQLLEKQLNSTFDFLEQGIYTIEVFTKRNKVISKQMKDINNTMQKVKKDYQLELDRDRTKTDIVPMIENVLDLYNELKSPESKNELLKRVIDHVTYLKEEPNKKGCAHIANFKLQIWPKLPKNTN